MKLKGLIFDLDGTLLNTIPVCYGGFRKTLLEFTGREYSDQEIAAMFGPTEDGIFKKLFPSVWKESLESYLVEYDRIHPEYAEPFNGVLEALALLQERRIKLALVSGKGPGSMKISLKHSGLGGFFEVVKTGSEERASKPEHLKEVLKIWGYSPEEIAYVGDMAYDVSSAKEVGVYAIGAMWAKTTHPQKILEMNPDVAFDNVQSFIEWIKQTL
ncbi:HAD family hydrolase [Desulfosporosinus sp. BG]|uniref:HAD family hydrolase n=1 Tax=Desulfosporosinus sp. BG TaxID=1633135 RepID=UPI00083A38D2|nr:HAD family hydrolase [Desulfosporosinus sp. BG]ODA43002.1 Phosphoglycolate phosphatase [Desulfosporosinus sp. BG]